MTDRHQPAPADKQASDAITTTPFAALTRLGEVLILQLLFLVASVPVVTVLPAAMALQRSLSEQLSGTPRPAATFVSHLSWTLRRFWLTGLLLVVGVVVGAVAWQFWS